MNKTLIDRKKITRGFRALNITQFQGALSDNIFKLLVTYFLIDSATALNAGVANVQLTSQVTAFASIMFAVPFVIFAGIFGAINDRFSKQRIAMLCKYLEVAIMAIASLAFLSGNAFFLWTVLFLMGTHSALFGPAKYGILPEILPETRLSWGNGVIQGATMVAATLGTVLAGQLYESLTAADALPSASLILIALAIVGVIASHHITRPEAANPNQPLTLNPFVGMREHFRAFRADRWLLLTVIGYTYFWAIAAFIMQNLLAFGGVSLGVGEDQISYLLGATSIGIALGAVGAGYVSRGKIEVGLIPLGALGMTLFSCLLAVNGLSFNTCLLLLAGLGFFGGIFDVPLIATLQNRSPKHMRGGIMATANMLTWLGILAASGLYFALGAMNVSPRIVFLIAGVMSLGVGIYICLLLPVFVLRLILWVLANTLYRLRVIGRSNIPEHGGGLLIANHTSFLDALVIIASIDRPVRFIMYQGIYEVPWIKPLARLMGAIPVTPGGGPREVVQSLRNATEAIEHGELVCIFAEGQITRTGQMLPFRRGFERIMKGVDAPIIPVYIDQIWGSIFSFAEGRFFWKWPRRIPFHIAIAYGPALPPTANAYDVRSAIQELGTEAYCKRMEGNRLLHREFFRIARRHPLRMAVADLRSGKLSYAKTLIGSVVLARKLHALLGPEKLIGVLLPQGVGCTLVNIALPLMGKVPVNLNYTASKSAIANSAEQCGMKQVITARAFLEIMPVDVPGEAIYVEDILKTVEKKDRIRAAALGFLCPIKRLERMLGAPDNRTCDELATVIFSSGSEGEPKGIMLSHYNVLSNIESAIQVFPHKKWDVIVGMLPIFHSFGYTGTLWVPLTQELSVIFHPNPLEARQIGELIEKYKGKILFSTSTFLQNFIRRCNAKQLSTLEYIVTGAEKLAPRVRDAFKEKFGVEPLEGYGTTECAPIVSLNLPDFRAPGFYQKGTKRGSIGHPIPGISVRIVDPDSREVLQNGEAGVLQVKGPNIMQGYLHQREKTDAVLQNGWYETGDIATIDEEGFITITDRLARFSKIAGEMVSHTKIEDELHRVIDQAERMLAVAGVPDPMKGERLVVLHTLTDELFDELMTKLDETGLPNLWIPKAKAYYKVEQIPILGTGKMDLKAVKNLAKQLDIGE